MGLDTNAVKFLLCAKAAGVSFAHAATLGRQGLHVRPETLLDTLEKAGYTVTADSVAQLFATGGGFAEPFLQLLGAEVRDSFDYSSFEGATHVHDINTPLPDGFHCRYDLVLDCGTLEHVFNFPAAMQNCMEMVKPGGHLLVITPANNFLGHGFYQFSPELFYATLSPANGFEVVAMIAYEDVPGAQWYSVCNPREVGGRVTLANSLPTYLAVLARRTKEQPIFAVTPQQSDYASAWVDAQQGAKVVTPPWQAHHPPSRLVSMLSCLPRPVRLLLRWLLGHDCTGFDKRFFRPVNWRSVQHQGF
jgi:SAM-dependent methyltransferase